MSMFPYDNKWTPMKKLVWLRGNPAGGGGGSDPLNTFTGAIVRFLAKKAKPIVKLEANFTPIQSGTGDPSPENIRPISGHTGCDVWDDPKHGGSIMWNQMFDGTGQRTSDGITTEYDSENNAIKITNNSRTSNYSSGSTRASVIDSTELVTDHKYYCKLSPEITGLTIVYSNSTKPLKGTIFAYDSTTWISLRVTNDYDFVTAHPVGDVTEVQLNFFDLTEMFGAGNEPTTVEEFEALFPKDYYEPQVTPVETCVSAVNGDPYVKVPVSFGTTVYGGTLTVNEDGSGSIKARPYYSSYNGEALVGPWVSSMDAYAPGATPTTGAQVVDMGGTETTIPLTASQISTLVGNNVVWVTDADGDITVQAYGTPVGEFSPIVGTGQAGHMIV